MVDVHESERGAGLIRPELRKYPLKHEEFETIKQEGDADCGAAVVAMAVGLPLKHVKSDMISTQMEVKGECFYYYKVREIARYLACHGILMGMHAQTEGDGGSTLEPDERVMFAWPLEDFPAILGVRSERFKDQDHWVFWDGQKVRDPNPNRPDLRELNEFKVLDVFPLVHYTE